MLVKSGSRLMQSCELRSRKESDARLATSMELDRGLRPSGWRRDLRSLWRAGARAEDRPRPKSSSRIASGRCWPGCAFAVMGQQKQSGGLRLDSRDACQGRRKRAGD